MGAWGEGVLENDEALDWLGDLEDDPQVLTVMAALTDATRGGGLDSYEGMVALVAAELVAAACGRSGEERLVALARSWPELAAETDLAVRAVDAVADPEASDLTDLWTEDGPNPEWEAVLSDLRGRLQGDG